MINKEYNPHLDEVNAHKAEWVLNMLVNAVLIDYFEEKKGKFPAVGEKWNKQYEGHPDLYGSYTVTLKGQRGVRDAFAKLEDTEGVYILIWDEDEEMLIGQPIQITWKEEDANNEME